MKTYMEDVIALATIGSFCIIIATFIGEKISMPGIKEISGGFLTAGFLMIFVISTILISKIFRWRWGEDKLCPYFLFIAIMLLFLSSLFLMINYFRYIFFT